MAPKPVVSNTTASSVNGRRIPCKATERNVLSVTELCASYLRFAKGYYVKDGKQTDEIARTTAAIKYLQRSYSKVPVTEFGPLALDVVRQQIIESGNTRSYINSLTNLCSTPIQPSRNQSIDKRILNLHANQVTNGLKSVSVLTVRRQPVVMRPSADTSQFCCTR